MTLKAHASKPLTREKPPTIYPSNFVLPSTQNEWWRGKDSNLRRRKPADLQSAPVGRLGTPPGKNEPRILVSTPRSVNGIGAYFAVLLRPLFRGTHLYRGTEGYQGPTGAPPAKVFSLASWIPMTWSTAGASLADGIASIPA